ncbi:squamous cell carcinoma antigen recognized by T-cells 3 [Ricinus communis]|uniref:squamous cell carcinoma antigen recognized by T-cells 3 n=1 Tax=Ricinus communis TaxID=3988 RepID=UPI00201ABEF8|nr:squamous cell carcinoma antigen recognized by T-cells 3 [Ricinus communis]
MEVEQNQNQPKTPEEPEKEEIDNNNNNDDSKSQNLQSKPNSISYSSSSDSSDDSDADSEDESHQNEQLKSLEAELSSNPSNYDAHVQYIKLLRKMGEIEKLREAREAMSASFPLTPIMWQEWAKDEASLSTGPEGYSVVEKLYERGVSDYLSVPLWCDYLNYVQECNLLVRECSSDGLSKARNIYERALTAAGLHVAEGNKLWDSYREFEQAILLTMDETDTKVKESQVQRIRNIFHRQLSVPLHNLRSTLLAYKAWEVEQGNVLDTESSYLDGISSHVASAYQKAMEMYNTRAQHEEQIYKQDISEQEKFQNFMNYLNFEKTAGDPARVQVLYERAITEFPVSSDIWLDYTCYLDKTLKVGNIVKDAYFRATRNCSWVGELWVRYLLSLERSRAHEKEISTVFEESLQCLFSTAEEYLDLFLTRVDGLRRRILFGSEAEGVLNYSLIKETMQHASDYLSPQLKNTEGLLRLHAYWARLELNLGKDLVAARGVWESLLKISGSMLEVWQGYITMETELGHINEARSIYKRCYSKRFTGTGSEDICHSWLRFEREFGALEDFDHAVQKVTPRLEELQLYRMQQESKAFVASADQKENPIKRNVREKRKGGPEYTDEQSPAKRKKQTPQTQKGYEKSKDQPQNLAEVTKPKVEKTDSKQEKQQKDYDSGRNKGYTDQYTAFLSNLHLKANYEDLRKFFSDVGGVVSIRILLDKYTGKSRGLAYVDFSDDEHLAAAIAKNKQMLLGKRLSIARSNPKQNKKGGRDFSKQQTHTDQSAKNEESASYMSTETSKGSRAPQSANRKLDDNIQLKGKNTFLVPRNVKPLGWDANKPKTVEEGDEKPKSNDEFRKMFIKD